jgi:carbon storage regulator
MFNRPGFARNGGEMLILTRRPQEALVIGSEVTVTVLAVNGTQVRLGINAPKSIAVHRGEVHRRIKSEPLGDRAL